ncbi:MAG TPA: Amuc_1100 family pilus-like protein [Kiritimatiellia bacterium]|nr:Amuc_1100 family pilus-like protein [Kiritimatiellia bacterium]HPS07877.1 Amuc_1100 family pilus-like protein [Kiritimatiellia bacterium]
MKRHQIILIGCGILMAVVCLGACWFLFSAISVKREQAESRNQAYEELQGIYRAKVFPSDENVARMKEDEKAIEAWLVTASNLVHKGDLQTEQKTPTGFKQVLQATVRELSVQAGANQGKIVAPGFNFGFDKYLGQSDSLPQTEHVDRLTGQLAIIEKICKELYAANILELKAVGRETFDEVKAEQPREEEKETSRKSRRRRNRDSGDAASAAPAASSGPSSGYFSKQRFTFEFLARPAAFIEALNRLAALDLFVVVAETQFRKTGDPLAARNAARKESAAKPVDAKTAVVDPATLTHVERIVTDPELEPPVSVKIDVDVYSFEGV